MKNEWKIGDRVKHFFQDGNVDVLDFTNYDEMDQCKKHGCINLSLRGRKAYATFMKKAKRDSKGRFRTKKEIDWEIVAAEIKDIYMHTDDNFEFENAALIVFTKYGLIEKGREVYE